MNFQELKEIGLKNPKGKIVAEEATGNDVNNDGSWNGLDATRDIYFDVLEAASRLKSNPTKIIGSEWTLNPLFSADSQYIHPVWLHLLPIFWFASKNFLFPGDFISIDNTADPGIVLLVGQDERDVVYIDTR